MLIAFKMDVVGIHVKIIKTLVFRLKYRDFAELSRRP